VRRRSRRSPTPERLRRFAAAEWPQGDVWEAFACWRGERRAWAAEHRFTPANRFRRTSTDSPIGTIVDQLRFEIAARRDLERDIAGS
jgi:hypothetical protein